MSAFNTPAIETAIFDYFEKVADEPALTGFTLTLKKLFVLDNTQCTAVLLCAPNTPDTRDTVANVTLDMRVAGEETITITGSSFDFAGPGIRTIKGLASRTTAVCNHLDEALDEAAASDLSSEGMAPALLAGVLAETMHQAGYTA